MADDDWSHVFNEKEFAELDDMFTEITLQIAVDSENNSGDQTEYLQVTALIPIDKALPLATEIYDALGAAGEELDEFFTMLVRGVLWQYKTERPDDVIDSEIERFFLDGWDADGDDSIEFY